MKRRNLIKTQIDCLVCKKKFESKQWQSKIVNHWFNVAEMYCSKYCEGKSNGQLKTALFYEECFWLIKKPIWWLKMEDWWYDQFLKY